jgi:hypothetical protein
MDPAEKLLTSEAIGQKAVPIEVDQYTSQVWAVTSSWGETGTTAARAAGLAWPANSGLRWDEKFSRWVASLPSAVAEDGSRTFSLTTPYGKTLRMPALECSEQALLLRAVFASWYGLPFFVEASDGTQRIFLGHFGFRTTTGRYRGMPEFKTQYADYSARGASALTNWPHDAALRTRHLTDSDGNPWLAANAGFGLWADEALLNKRVGWMLLYLLDWYGSMHLASAANAFHAAPATLRAGDVLVQRWQKNGVGHVLIAKQVTPVAGGLLSVENTSGSMPRRAPRWDDAAWSRSYYLASISGGTGTSEDGWPYAKLGGGLRRFRVAQIVGGYWVNDVPSWEVQQALDDNDTAGIAARPAQFAKLLADVPPEQKIASLAAQIAQARQFLVARPASCPTRTQREALFTELYQVAAAQQGLTRAQVDAKYRTTIDYALPELKYTSSPTCCWDTTTPAMYSLIDRLNRARQAQAAACLPPLTFTKANYPRFKAYAQQVGEAANWRDWSQDEPCAQKAAADDVLAPQQATDYCTVQPALAADGR